MTLARTYLLLYLHVLRLAGRALSRRWKYLPLAPAIAIPQEVIVGAISRITGASFMTSLLGGFVISLIFAAALSAVLFVGRAIIEQRLLRFDDLIDGLVVFLNDLLAVLFVLWIAWILTSPIPFAGLVLMLVPVAMPLVETVALSAVGGYAVFGAAWRFLRRDAFPWLVGHLPLLLLIPAYRGAAQGLDVLMDHAPPRIDSILSPLLGKALFYIFLLIAFVYRGILFLTLDNTSPRARAERFGGAPGLR